jgi:Mrp family chromosome partitioning ATPase
MSGDNILQPRPPAPPDPETGAGPRVPLFRRPSGPVPPVRLDQRTGREVETPAAPDASPAQVWESLAKVAVDAGLLHRNGLFPDAESQPPGRPFDLLRTRCLQVMARKGWTRLAVTAPTPGCGTSLVAANLALALARLPACRTVLMDLNLRAPRLAGLLGQTGAGPLAQALLGGAPPEVWLRRIGRDLAVALNGAPGPRPAEVVQAPAFGSAMQAMLGRLQPDIVVIDCAPALEGDAVLALSGHVDAVLLVADGTATSPDQIEACARLLRGHMPLLGVVLNRAQDRIAVRRQG